MKKTFLLFIFLLTVNLFAQKNNFYKISYIDSLNQKQNFSEIEVVNIDTNNLTFKRIYNKGDNITPPETFLHKIKLSEINSFGYRAYTTLGTRIGTGILIGAGTGALLGALASTVSFEGPSDNSALAFAAGGGLVCGMIGGFVGAATGIGAKEYETINLSKYSGAMKYNIIERMIATGKKKNNDK